jgi:recombination protein RecA
MPNAARLETLLEHHRKRKDKTNELETKVEKHRTTFTSFNPAVVAKITTEVAAAISSRTGIASLDKALGGGLPAGTVEIYGEESVGKTSLVYEIITEAQETGRKVLLVASEFLDTPYMKDMGIDLEKLHVVKGQCAETVLQVAGIFFAQENVDIMVVDSATGLRPKDDTAANWRAMIYSWLDVLVPDIGLDKCVILTNQVRAKRSISPEKFFAGGTDSVAKKIAGLFDTRMELSRSAMSEDSYDLNINIVTNTISRPGRIVTLPFVKGQGIDIWRDLVRVASEAGILSKEGSWYRYKGALIEQGEVATSKMLRDNPIGVRVKNDVMGVIA